MFVFWRAFIDGGDLATPVALIEQTRIYPLAAAGDPPDMDFPNGSGTPADMVFPQDYRYFEMLAEFVETEFVGPEDWAMRGMMASLGIVKGKPFDPDERMRGILEAAVDVGVKMAKAIRFGDYLPGTKYYDDRQWHNVLNVLDVEFNEDTFLNVDARVGMFEIGYSISLAMVMNMVGKGLQVSVCLPRRGRRVPVGRSQLPAPPAPRRPGSELLVDHDVRRGQRLGPRQRSAVPLHRLTR